MRFQRACVGIVALMYLYFGVLFLWNPVDYAATVDLQLLTDTAVAEVRAMYGGFELGVAAFLIVALFQKKYFESALLFSLLSVAGFMVGRAIGIVLSENVKPIIFTLFALEVVGTPVLLYAWVKRPSTSG